MLVADGRGRSTLSTIALSLFITIFGRPTTIMAIIKSFYILQCNCLFFLFQILQCNCIIKFRWDSQQKKENLPCFLTHTPVSHFRNKITTLTNSLCTTHRIGSLNNQSTTFFSSFAYCYCKVISRIKKQHGCLLGVRCGLGTAKQVQ